MLRVESFGRLRPSLLVPVIALGAAVSPVATGQIESSPKSRITPRNDTTLCLAPIAKAKEKSVLSLAQCTAKPSTSNWTYEASTGLIRSSADSTLCVVSDVKGNSDTYLMLGKCENNPKAKWTYD